MYNKLDAPKILSILTFSNFNRKFSSFRHDLFISNKRCINKNCLLDILFMHTCVLLEK